MAIAPRNSKFSARSLFLALLSSVAAGIFMLSAHPLQAQTPLPDPTAAASASANVPTGSSIDPAPAAAPVAAAAPPPDIATADLRALMPDFTKGKNKTAFGKVMLEEYYLDTMTIVRMQAQKSVKANNIEQMMAADTTSWRGTPIKMEAAKSPYNTVVTVVGTALADGEAAVLWQVGWTDEGDKGAFQILSSGPKEALTAGQRVTFTAAPRATSVRDPKALTLGLQLANPKNFKIEAVRVQVWSGMPDSSFLSGTGSFLVYGSATGGIMIGLWWFFFRRNSYSVNDELAGRAQDEDDSDDRDESFQRRKKLAASKAAALAATGKPGELPPPEVMSPDEFTAHFMRELGSNTGGAGMSTREPLEVRVQTPDGIEKTLFLANAYMSYKRNPSELKRAVDDQINMYVAQFPDKYSAASTVSAASAVSAAPSPTASISGNHAGGALDFTTDDSLNLKIVRPVTGGASAAARAASIAAAASPTSNPAPASQPVTASLGVPHHQIFATIKHPAYLASVREQLLRAGASESEISMQLVTETLNDELIVVYMIDTPEAMRALTAKDLADSALARNSLRSLALTNLGNHVKKHGMKLVDVPVEGSDAKVYGVRLDGNYEATLMLVNSIWTNPKFKVKGKPVVFPLARDVLMITGSEDTDGLQAAASRSASTFAETPYAISPHGFVYDNGSWTRITNVG